MMEAGGETLEKDMECKFGQTGLDIKEIGIITKPMGRENLYM